MKLESNMKSPQHAYTPQQNGVVERKNRTLITLARTMLDEYNTPEALWAEAINTTCYIKPPIPSKVPWQDTL